MPFAPSHSFRFEDLDQRLFAPKRDELTEEARKKIADFQKGAHLPGYLSRLLDFQEGLTERWADWFYTGCCETWKEQGQSISPQFLIVISYKITQLIKMQFAHVQAEEGGRSYFCSNGVVRCRGRPFEYAPFFEIIRQVSVFVR